MRYHEHDRIKREYPNLLQLAGFVFGGVIVGLWRAGLVWEGVLAGATFGFLIWFGMKVVREVWKDFKKYNYKDKKPKDDKEAAYAIWANIGAIILAVMATFGIMVVLIAMFMNYGWLQSLEAEKKCPDGVLGEICYAELSTPATATQSSLKGISCEFATEPQCVSIQNNDGSGGGGCFGGTERKSFSSWQEAKAFKELNPKLTLQKCE